MSNIREIEMNESVISDQVAQARIVVNNKLSGEDPAILGIAGGCALTEDVEIINREGDQLADRGALQRLCFWKPRSDPQAYHGLDTTKPECALQTVEDRSYLAANVCAELGLPKHIGRYAAKLTFAWTGGRNDDNFDLKRLVALSDPTLSLGAKNGLNGEIDIALRDIEELVRLRGSDGAEVVLIYRGGFNAQTPDDWEKQYIRAHELTGGRFIVDTAHGGEMAHSPDQDFTKSVLGQIACLDHVMELARDGLAPRGVMMEASDTISPTDPNMPFTAALTGLDDLNAIIAAR